MKTTQKVVVYGANGHTGSLVLEALRREGFAPVAAGRNRGQLEELAATSDISFVTADVASPETLDRALADATAVVNCAGPFGPTAHPLIAAALRRGIHYLDTGADPSVIHDIVQQYHKPAQMANVVVAPGVGFFGALADWMATSIAQDLSVIDTVEVAFALSDWIPTRGSLAAGAVMRDRRWVHENGHAALKEGRAPIGERFYAEPFGQQQVLSEYPGAEAILLPLHLPVRNMRVQMAIAGMRHVMSTRASDGRVAPDNSDQRFLVEVVVSSGEEVRRISASGFDIYRTTAPMMVEAVRVALRKPPAYGGVVTPAQLVDSRTALAALQKHGTSRLANASH